MNTKIDFDSIRTRLILIFVTMVLVPVIVIGIVNTNLSLKYGFKEAQQKLDTIANSKKERIDNWTQSLKLDLENTLVDERLNWHINVLLLKGDSLNLFRETSYNQVQENFNRRLKQTKNFETLFLLDIDGNVTFSTDKRLTHKNYRNTLFFKNGLQSFVVPAPIHLPLLNDLSIFAAMPFKNLNGEVVGLLVGMADMSFLNNLMQNYQGLGSSGETYLVDINKGRLLTNTRTHLKVQNHDLGSLEFTNYIKAVPGTIAKYRNYGGNKMIGVKKSIDQIGVVMIAEIEEREAFSLTYKMLNMSLMVASFAAFIAIFIGAWQTRHIVSPLAELSSAAAKVTSTNLDIQVTNQGSTEVRSLVTAFNSMTLRIRNLLEDVRKSEQNHLTERLKAEKANQAKSIFLSSMSHELRTPLNSILGFSQILETSENLSEDEKNYLGYVIKNGMHLLKLIEDILQLSGIDPSEVAINLEELSSKAIIQKVISLTKVLSEKAGITIHQTPDEDFTIISDSTRLIQVLLNLISNAIKYNKKNGSVVITCCKIENDFVRISVTDSGIGISKKYEDKIFTPFSRLGMENSGIQGTGIGLVVSKNLVELINGKLDYKSTPGVGSTFWIDIPMGNITKINNSVTTQELFHINHKMKVNKDSQASLFHILYVEDNYMNQVLVETYFKKREQVLLTIVGSAEEGLIQLENNKYDLVLMDIHLPGMSGNDLAKKIKENEKFKNIPIVALTAVAPELNNASDNIYFDDYITKPIMFNKLDEILKSFIG